jgi:hypothetical protein
MQIDICRVTCRIMVVRAIESSNVLSVRGGVICHIDNVALGAPDKE